MKKIEYGTEFLDQLKDSVHDLYDRNQELLSSNVKLREEKIKLKGIINKTIEYIENCHGMYRNTIGDIQPMINIKPVLEILKEIELTENDKKQVKWLKEEFKVGVDKE